MDPIARNLWGDEQLNHLISLVPGSALKPELISDSEGLVYRLGNMTMAKIYPGAFRSREELEDEISWVGILSEKEIPVARFLPFEDGSFLKEIPCGGPSFLACKMVELGGQRIRRESFVDRLQFFSQAWGKTLGRLHKYGASSLPQTRKPHWNKHRDFSKQSLLPENQRLHECVEGLYEILKNRDVSSGYGLIHGDLHQGNFLVDDQGSFHVFDFDDMHQNWFLYDFAVIQEGVECGLLYQDMERAPDFLQAFSQGYLEILELPDLKDLPLFRAYRKFTLLIYCLENHFDRTEDQRDREAYEHYLSDFCERMETLGY